MSRLIAPLACSLTISLVASACNGASGGASATRQYATDSTFTMAVNFDPGVYDPYRGTAVTYLAYDSLVNLRKDGVFTSGLAEKWNANATSATFILRPDVTCSNGAPLTAGQVAADINYVTDPKNHSTRYGQDTPTVPLTATGDDASRTVQIAVKRPFGFLLQTIGRLPIMCARGLKDPKALGSGSDGTGPFTLTGIVPGQRYTFTVRKDYKWGPGGASTSRAGTPKSVVIRVVNNESATANLLLSGEVNFANIQGEDQQRLSAQGLAKVKALRGGAFLFFNHRGDRPTADQRVRAALTQALDLDEVIRVNGGVGRATGLVPREPKVCPGNTVVGRLPARDVAAAARALDQAGWIRGSDGYRRNGGKPLVLDLHYVPGQSAREKPTAELLAQRWQSLGVRVKLTGDSYPNLARIFHKTSSFDVLITGFGLDLPPQVATWVSGPVPPNGSNFSGIENEDYNRLSAKAAALSAPEGCGYWNEAEQALFRDVDVVPISTQAEVYYLKNAEAQVVGIVFPVPTSIRLLK